MIHEPNGSHDSLINDLWSCQTSSEPNLLEKRFEGIRGVCEGDRQTETITNLYIEICVPTSLSEWVTPTPITNPFTKKGMDTATGHNDILDDINNYKGMANAKNMLCM